MTTEERAREAVDLAVYGDAVRGIITAGGWADLLATARQLAGRGDGLVFTATRALVTDDAWLRRHTDPSAAPRTPAVESHA